MIALTGVVLNNKKMNRLLSNLTLCSVAAKQNMGSILTLRLGPSCQLLIVYLTKYGITFKVVAGKIPMVDLSSFNKSKRERKQT